VDGSNRERNESFFFFSFVVSRVVLHDHFLFFAFLPHSCFPKHSTVPRRTHQRAREREHIRKQKSFYKIVVLQRRGGTRERGNTFSKVVGFVFVSGVVVLI
jgi:hypothetical protein